MPPKKKAAKGYALAEALPAGEVVEDITKRKFIIGPTIGNGGFGMIYSAQEANSSSSKYPYVLKIEPHANGPLFVESHFYMRNGKPDEVEAYKKKKGLKFLGMPVCHAKGSHEYNGTKYRFLIMDKFGKDLWKLFLENGKQFPAATVFKIAIQILDVLEYIHSRGYVHADIKAANILLGPSKETQNKQVHLVDFGLATKYSSEKDFKPDPKRAHDGTIEYLSRDAHQGVQTRRGDLEILAYNLIQWLGTELPWESNLSDPKKVQQSKETHMASIPKFLKACFKDKTPPKALIDFLTYLKTLNFNTEPNYSKIRKIFMSGVKEAGGSLDSPLQFSVSKNTPKKRKSPAPKSPLVKRSRGKKSLEDVEEDSEGSDVDERKETPKKAPPQKKTTKKPVREASPSDDEEEVENSKDIPAKKAGRPRKKVEDTLNSSTDGMTAAMREIANRLKNGASQKKKGAKSALKPDIIENGQSGPTELEGYTESMKELALKKNQRLKVKKKI